MFVKQKKIIGQKSENGISTHNKLTHLHNIIIKEQPEVMTFYNGNVVPPVRTTAETQDTVLQSVQTNNTSFMLHFYIKVLLYATKIFSELKMTVIY